MRISVSRRAYQIGADNMVGGNATGTPEKFATTAFYISRIDNLDGPITKPPQVFQKTAMFGCGSARNPGRSECAVGKHCGPKRIVVINSVGIKSQVTINPCPPQIRC